MGTARFLAFRCPGPAQRLFTKRSQKRDFAEEGRQNEFHNKAGQAAKIQTIESLFVAFAALL